MKKNKKVELDCLFFFYRLSTRTISTSYNPGIITKNTLSNHHISVHTEQLRH